MIFILSFTVFGASGTPRPFPSVSSNTHHSWYGTWLYYTDNHL